MDDFIGCRLYGQVSGEKLTMWIPSELYKRIYKHCATFCYCTPKEVSDVDLKHVREVKGLITLWLEKSVNQKCDWVFNDSTPESPFPLTLWQAVKSSPTGGNVLDRFSVENRECENIIIESLLALNPDQDQVDLVQVDQVLSNEPSVASTATISLKK